MENSKVNVNYTIDILNKLNDNITKKIERLKSIASEKIKCDEILRIQNKITGVELAKEEIRREIGDLKLLIQDSRIINDTLN